MALEEKLFILDEKFGVILMQHRKNCIEITLFVSKLINEIQIHYLFPHDSSKIHSAPTLNLHLKVCKRRHSL